MGQMERIILLAIIVLQVAWNSFKRNKDAEIIELQENQILLHKMICKLNEQTIERLKKEIPS